MSNLEDIVIRVADFIKRYKCIKSVNIKFTLGKYTDAFGFEKHIFQKDNYDKIMQLLNKCSTWDDTAENTQEKMKYEPEKIVDSLIITCKNGPYDIIITAETKKQTNFYVSDDFSCILNTYKRKNHTFYISKQNTSLDETFYTAYIIADIPQNYTDTYIAHSSLLKIQDLINVCNTAPEQLVFSILQKNN